MSARRLSLIGLLACLAGVAVPAHGASGDGVTVVARDGPVALIAEDDDISLCLQLGGEEFEAGGACSPDAGEIGVVAGGPGGEQGYAGVGVAVPATAARVEVRRAGRLLGGGPTVAGEAYRGRFKGKVRFAIVRLPAGARTDALRVHVFDAAGALTSVFAAGEVHDLVLDRRRALAGRSGRVTWSIATSRVSSLRPTAFDLAHESLLRCVDWTLSTVGRNSRACAGDTPRDRLAPFGPTAGAATEDSCDPDFRLLHGVVASTVQRVTVLLGDGRRVAARSTVLPGGEYRAYALQIGRADAIRRVELRGRSGAPEIVAQGTAPLSIGCTSRGSLDVFSIYALDLSGDLPVVTPPGPVTTLPGTPAVRVADGPADTLCVALGDRPFTALGCEIVSPELEEPLAVFDSRTEPQAFAIALPARVATLRIAGPGGAGTRDIATVPAVGYDGIYASGVRFATGTIAGRREFARVELLDDAGRLLYRNPYVPVTTSTPQIATPRRIAGRAGSPALWRTSFRVNGRLQRCLALTAGPRPSADESCAAIRFGATTVLLDAACATRRLTVAVATTPGTRVLADTGSGAPRRMALRAGAGLLTLAPGTGLRSLTFVHGSVTDRVAIDAPPGARQCGWSVAEPRIG